MKKKIVSLILLCVMAAMTVVPASAAGTSLRCIHGNEGSRCFAEIIQPRDDYKISAQITWQLANKNEVKYGDYVSSRGKSAKSRSSWLWARSGQSFGYYYANDKLIHKSTAWMPFDF